MFCLIGGAGEGNEIQKSGTRRILNLFVFYDSCHSKPLSGCPKKMFQGQPLYLKFFKTLNKNKKKMSLRS